MSNSQLTRRLDVHGLTCKIEDLKPYFTNYVYARILENESGCWIYNGATSKAGYANIYYEGKTWRGHRLTRTLLIGPIPDEEELDHTCHDPYICKFRDRNCPHRPCIHPLHTESVSHGENQFRGGKSHDLRSQTHCINGHPYTPRNTYIAKNSTRACQTCRAIATREYYLKTHPNAKVKSDISWWTADV